MSDDALEALDRMIEERNKAKDDEIDRLRAKVERLREALRACRDGSSSLYVYKVASEALEASHDEQS